MTLSLPLVIDYLTTHKLESAGLVTTVAGIWLTTRRNMLCWPITLAADLLYLAIFFEARLLSDSLLQAFFIAFTLYGWWHWQRGVRVEGEVRIAPISRPALVAGLVAGVVGSLLLGALMQHLGAALAQLDATLTAFSLVASWWAARKHTLNWALWIVVDLAYIGEYIYKGLVLTALLYALLVVLAILGLRSWSQAPSEEAVTA